MVKASEVSEVVSTTIVSVGEELTSTIGQIQTAVDRADGLIQEAGTEVVAVTKSSRAVARDVETLVADVRAGRGTVGKLFNDEALHQRVEDIASDLQAVSEDAKETFSNVRAVSHEAKAAIQDLRAENGSSPGLLAEISRTLASANEAASDLAENTESMKRSFLFRGMFLDRGYFDLDALTPQEYVEGALRGNHQVRRFWLPAEDLLELDAKGEEVLSAAGAAKIRSAMSEVLRYPPDSPLIAEGYSDSGPVDERYLKARRRAFLVRDYIVRSYFRDPNYTGFIALGNVSPNDVADDEDAGMGDSGVVLALYYDKESERSPRHRAIQ